MFHNHNREFAMVEGKTVLDRICEAFPENQLGITADVYWIQYAGENPISWLYKLKGRTDCVHFKDMSHNANGDVIMVPNGDVKFGYIEQDNCNGEDPFACMKRSYDFFRSRGLH